MGSSYYSATPLFFLLFWASFLSVPFLNPLIERSSDFRFFLGQPNRFLNPFHLAWVPKTWTYPSDPCFFRLAT
jgi:hypothetical protein